MVDHTYNGHLSHHLIGKDQIKTHSTVVFKGSLLVVLLLPFRDYSFIVDEDDIALLEALEEKKQEEEEEDKIDSSWPQYYERENDPLPQLENNGMHWDGIPPPDLLRHELFIIPFLATGLLLFCLAAVAIMKPPLSLTKFNLILALHGLLVILVQVVQCFFWIKISELSDNQGFEMKHNQDTGGEEWDAAVEAQRCQAPLSHHRLYNHHHQNHHQHHNHHHLLFSSGMLFSVLAFY